MSPPGIRIVIIGAGIGGLTLALLLRRRGMAAEILEQASELGEAGAGIALASNATRVLQRLGLGDDLARLSTEPTALVHRGSAVPPRDMYLAQLPERLAWIHGHDVLAHELQPQAGLGS